MNKDFIKALPPWEKVEIARNKARPTGEFYIENICIL